MPAAVLLRSPSPCPHAQDRFRIGEGNAFDVSALLELAQKPLAVELWCDRLPIDTGHRCLIKDQQRRHPGPDRDGKVRRGDLLDFQLDHDVFGDPPAFGGTILQPVKPVLHHRDPALEPCGQGFIGQRRAHDCRDNLMDVGQALDRVGEGLFIDLRVFRPDPVSDRAVGDGGEFETS